MDAINLPAGTKVLLGKPAHPMDRASVRAIAGLLGSAREVLEAHLPQCYVPGTMQQPAQVLVIVLPDSVDADSVTARIREGLAPLIPVGHHLDIWPLRPASNVLAAVRATGCDIRSLLADAGPEAPARPARKWWKFW